jgi:hypothetical protein
MELFRAIKVVENKDKQEFRQFVFKDLRSRNLYISMANKIFVMLPHFLFRPIFISFYGLISFVKIVNYKGTSSTLALYAYKNELRQFDFLKSNTDRSIDYLKDSFKVTNIFSFFAIAPLLFDRRIYRIIKRINLKHNNFLLSCRVAATIFYYIKFLKVLSSNPQIKNVLVSSDSNPYAMGISFAAIKNGLNSVYINHGHIPEGPPPLFFDNAILDGPALLDTYKRAGKVRSKVTFKGIEGNQKELEIKDSKDYKRVGIFLSLVTDWKGLHEVIQELQEQDLEILVRLHPNLIIRDAEQVEKLRGHQNIKISNADKIASTDLENIDFVIGGNSSVLLTSLKEGKPIIYCQKIDRVPKDFYLFDEIGIVYSLENFKKLDIQEILNFYSSKEWKEKYKYFNSDNNTIQELKKNLDAIFKA